MEYDRDKVDEMVLALLWLTPAGDGRAWKGHDWDAMERLHARGYISDPKSKAKSVLTEEGERLSRELFEPKNEVCNPCATGAGGAKPGVAVIY